MSTNTTQNEKTNISFWQKSLKWLRTFEEATDYDPARASIDHLSRQVTELKDTVRNLEARIDAGAEKRS